MKIVLVSLATIVFFASASTGADFVVAPPEQIVTQSHYTKSLKRDPWESDRWNYIDPKTGKRIGGFIKRDRWEPENRWNIYDSKGYPAGEWKQDSFDPERWNYSGGSSASGIEKYNDGIGEYNDGIESD
jgi:V8-like Glu-specific endopeptidase